MNELELLHKRRIFIQERIKSLTDIESNFEEIMSLLDEEDYVLSKIRLIGINSEMMELAKDFNKKPINNKFLALLEEEEQILHKIRFQTLQLN